MTEVVYVCACGCGEPAPTPARPDRYPDGRIYLPGHQNQRIDPDRPEKRCSKCGEVKPRSGFHKNRAMPDGLANYCKPCAITNAKQWQARGGHLMGRYGITPEMYRALYERQEGLCALCERRPIEVIDHDHETERVRGLLCRACNTGLGKLGDTPEAIERALAYVTSYVDLEDL